jgi:ribonuclease D
VSEQESGRQTEHHSSDATEPTLPALTLSGGLPPLVETPDALSHAAAALHRGTGPIAVDTERASGYRYSQRAYLVQLRRAGTGTILIDPVSVPSLAVLWRDLTDQEWIIHAASQDLPSLRMLGLEPGRIFDTELAGRLLNLPRVGLGPMVAELLGKHMAKEHSAADWSKRPLPESWLRYAALDVEVLVELRDILAERLAATGKAQWAEQEFEAVRTAPPTAPRRDPWRRVSGTHEVRSRRGLAVVKEVWSMREKLAEERDITPRRLLQDRAIIAVATDPPASAAELRKRKGFSGPFNRSKASQWLAAIRRGLDTPEADLPPKRLSSEGPPPPRSWPSVDPSAAARLAAVREAVAQQAAELDVPTENLLTPDLLRRLAWEPPEPSSAEAVAEALTQRGARPWQADNTAETIAAALHSAESAALEKPPDAT